MEDKPSAYADEGTLAHSIAEGKLKSHLGYAENPIKCEDALMDDTSSIERILISIVVRDKNAEKTVQAIIRSAQTGEIGDGRIFIIPIEDAIRIRTAERGDIALYNAEQER